MRRVVEALEVEGLRDNVKVTPLLHKKHAKRGLKRITAKV